MELQISFKDADGYLIARLEGEWLPDVIRDMIADVAIEAEERGYTRILFDVRKVSAPKTDFHRFLAGEQIAHAFRGRFKIASVYPSELIDKFAENTAGHL